MATKQYYVLYENASGYGLMLVKEFDEINKKFTANISSFLKPVSFIPFKSVAEALENVQAISEGRVTTLLADFLRQNLPTKDAILGVADKVLGEAILELDIGFECIWDASVRAVLRAVRCNSVRLLRSLLVDPKVVSKDVKKSSTAAEETVPGHKAEKRAQLVVALSRARVQLDISKHLADTGVIKSLSLLDSLDASLNKSVKHLRVSYGLHFPELCHNGGLPGLDDFAFASIVTYAPERDELISDRAGLLNWLNGDEDMANEIIELAKSSTGQKLAEDDIKTLQKYGEFLLKTLNARTSCYEMLVRRVRALVPNLTALMNEALPPLDGGACLERVRKVGDRTSPEIIAARLLSHAANLDRLAKMASSRVNSLGASRALFRRGGAVAATAAGLLGRTVEKTTASSSTSASSRPANAAGEASEESAIASLTQNIVDMSGGRLRSLVVRRKVARLLASKSTLAARADCYRQINPFISDAGVETPSALVEATEHLNAGDYGVALGQETKRQIRVWAEANGVHLERTVEELEKQRANRKKYRKAKRKAWLARKVAAANSNALKMSSNTEEKPEKTDAMDTSICEDRSLEEEDKTDSTATEVSSNSRKRLIDDEDDEGESSPAKATTPKRTRTEKAKTSASPAPRRVLRSSTRTGVAAKS